jgi:hypothetical protein
VILEVRMNDDTAAGYRNLGALPLNPKRPIQERIPAVLVSIVVQLPEALAVQLIF